MKGKLALALCGLVVALFVALPMGAIAQDEVPVGTGDWWKYVTEEDVEGMTMDFEYKIKVDSTDTVGGEDVFILLIDGVGEVSGDIENVSMVGDIEVSGVEQRTQSEFDLVMSEYVISIELEAVIITLEMEMGVRMENEPPMDDYIGDNAPALGVSVTSESESEIETWISETFTGNQTESQTSNVSMTMEVVDESESVTVPAGTFDCMKIKFDTTIDGETTTSYAWYSEEVCNYVKREGMPEDLAGFAADAELDSFSVGEGKSFISSLFGENWWILALVIAVVVILIIAIMMMGRKKKAMMMAPPPEMQPAPPPPPTS